MQKIVCELCGSNDLVKEDGFFVCQHCGTKYSPEEAKKLIVKGTVKIDNSEKLSNLYGLARRAREENNAENAAKYYGMALMDDPSNWEASFFSTYFTAIGYEGSKIWDAAHKIENCAKTAADLVTKNQLSPEEQAEAFEIIARYVGSAYGQFKLKSFGWRIGIEGAPPANMESSINDAITQMLLSTGDAIEKSCKQDQSICSTISGNTWELLISGGTPPYDSSVLNRIRRYKPNYQPPQQSRPSSSSTSSSYSTNSSSSGCYIATAVYGSYDCPQVWTLRRYRDFSLAKSWYGRSFIRLYYAISPILVKWFGKTNWFKNIWQRKLDLMVKRLQRRGFQDTPYEDQSW